MLHQKYQKPIILNEEEEEPAMPENPMERFVSAAQLDKNSLNKKVFLWGPVDDRSAKDITPLLFLDKRSQKRNNFLY
jgi:hypothetical protein